MCDGNKYKEQGCSRFSDSHLGKTTSHEIMFSKGVNVTLWSNWWSAAAYRHWRVLWRSCQVTKHTCLTTGGWEMAPRSAMFPLPPFPIQREGNKFPLFISEWFRQTKSRVKAAPLLFTLVCQRSVRSFRWLRCFWGVGVYHFSLG